MIGREGEEKKSKKKWTPTRYVSKEGYVMPITLPEKYRKMKTDTLVQVLGAVFSELGWYWKQEHMDPARRKEGIRIATENVTAVREELQTRKLEKIQEAMKGYDVPQDALTGTGKRE